ncbi:MAG: hypothetical protein OEZ10_01575 [Gammaproteobacteria bacterium]|nr:hypothetical protein [Gammaproteobacteria bacterium]
MYAPGHWNSRQALVENSHSGGNWYALADHMAAGGLVATSLIRMSIYPGFLH